MVIHREFVLDYTTEMVNTIMEVERGTNGLTFKYVYGALNEFGQQTRESVTITGTYTVNGRNGASTIRAVDETFFYHNNRLGSSEFLTSDVNGRIVSFVEYDQWGRPIGGDSLTLGNREIDLVTRFTGHRYDPVLGMYYARFRMYDATIRRFTATDPVLGTVLDPQTMVQYTYVLNNPMRYIDPWGLHPEERSSISESFGRFMDAMRSAGESARGFSRPPQTPCFDSITECVSEWIGDMTDEQVIFGISTGLFEAMGVSISSELIEGIASGGHIDMTELRQELISSIVDTIIEDNSGLGMDLLSGWEYRPGNSWYNCNDEDAVWGVIFPQDLNARNPAGNVGLKDDFADTKGSLLVEAFARWRAPSEIVRPTGSYVQTYSRLQHSSDIIYIGGAPTNFTVGQFGVHGTSEYILICDLLVYYMQRFDNHFDGALNINSGHRTPEHDREVGGWGAGPHVDGRAADFRIEGATSRELYDFARDLGFGGSFGFTYRINERSIHVDTRPR